MAALSLNSALCLSSAKSSVRIPARAISQHSLSLSGNFRAPCNSFVRLNGSKPRVLALPSRRSEFKSLCVTPASGGDGGEVEVHLQEVEEEEETEVKSAIPMVMAFYEGINDKQVNALTDLLADNCVLNDSQFPQAFVGKKVILKFMEKLIEAMGKGMKFAIEDISEGDDFTVVVLWHLEWEGRPLAFTRGCSFYHCEKQGERLYIWSVQDFIEPPIKPGEAILRLLKITSYLLENFPMVAQKLLTNPSHTFGGVIMIYRKFLNPIIWPFVKPFIIYYRWMVKILLYWAGFLFNIILKILKLFSK